MARPSRCRRICKEPVYDSFLPEGIPCGGQVTLTLDEYEVIRLIDLEKLIHEQCARQMDISRTTVTEVYEAAREKIADCIVNGRPLLIAGGNYRFCDGSASRYCRKACRRKQAEAGENNVEGTGCSIQPAASGDALPAKGEKEMRIAVTYENGEVYQQGRGCGHEWERAWRAGRLFKRPAGGYADLRRHRSRRAERSGGGWNPALRRSIRKRG